MRKSVRSRLLLGVSMYVAILAMGPALAADMSVKALPPIPVYNWTGFYIGAHVGGGWHSAAWFEDGMPSSPGFALGLPGLRDGTVNSSGVLGGGQAGFNYQIGSTVLGIEADGSGARILGSTACFPELVGTVQGCSTRVNSLGTVSARVGTTYYNLLLYFLGGGAWENERLQNLCDVCGPGGTPSSAIYSGTPWGWTMGVGVEYALPAGWSAFLQYNYVEFFRGRDLNFAGTLPFTENIRETLSVLKLGVNYRFEWGTGLMRY
jgi:outer membrane immunogenic protein